MDVVVVERESHYPTTDISDRVGTRGSGEMGEDERLGGQRDGAGGGTLGRPV